MILLTLGSTSTEYHAVVVVEADTKHQEYHPFLLHAIHTNMYPMVLMIDGHRSLHTVVIIHANVLILRKKKKKQVEKVDKLRNTQV